MEMITLVPAGYNKETATFWFKSTPRAQTVIPQQAGGRFETHILSIIDL